MIDRQIFGRQLIEFDEVDSTNLIAQDLLKNQKVFEGSVITANYQFQGRGQMGTSWVSQKGQNLLMSLVLTPTFLPIENQFYLSKIVAIGLVSVLKKIGLASAKIKWPNDIYVGTKKVSGILIESNLRGVRMESAVIGVGLNVNQEDFGIYKESSSSLKLLVGQSFQIDEVRNLITDELLTWYQHLNDLNYELIDNFYHKNLIYFNEWATYEIDSQQVIRKIVAVNAAGNLCLISQEGKITSYGMKELKFII
jgi:BirA family biotin operon repressor/biotin-[acetyl-CoA-carboxylase] ligase